MPVLPKNPKQNKTEKMAAGWILSVGHGRVTSDLDNDSHGIGDSLS
jgi:hypothetical protein